MQQDLWRLSCYSTVQVAGCISVGPKRPGAWAPGAEFLVQELFQPQAASQLWSCQRSAFPDSPALESVRLITIQHSAMNAPEQLSNCKFIRQFTMQAETDQQRRFAS